jgi:alkanesulfonate monooxygenase SsuD/methylene tetrahydromethanopterin reductase-like flavin-dependent oxidoreductase (luciferase family)
LTLGVGIGWSREEFDALGVPFRRRAARTAEYVAAMRTLWREDVASFHGEFVDFDAIRVNPKPLRDRRIPVVLGGNSDAALHRVVAWGDGWYGFNLLDVDDVAGRVAHIRQLCRDMRRDRFDLDLAVALRHPQVADVKQLLEIGVDELVLVGGPPEDPAAARDWIAALADRWLPALE